MEGSGADGEGADVGRVVVRLNANRKVTGVLRGYDQFMNLVLENAVEEISAENRADIGTVVRQRATLLRVGEEANPFLLGHSRQQCGDD